MRFPQSWGWDCFFEAQLTPEEKTMWVPVRLIAEHRGMFRAIGPDGEGNAVLSGKLRHALTAEASVPTVGDWVLADPGGDRWVIRRVLRRKTWFARKQAGEGVAAQGLAANAEIAYIATSLTDELNLRRIERYLVVVWESGASPVILLTKADLCADPSPWLAAVEAIAPGVPVFGICAWDATSLQPVLEPLGPGKTAVILGSSGVGKSTLINSLGSPTARAVGEVRESDGRGCHTTTARELVRLPNGAMVIDTPGLRELLPWEGGTGIAETFGEIADRSRECRFRDCTHRTEPGCAVIRAIERGDLDPARLESFFKLAREQEHLERKRDKAAASAQKKKWKQLSRALHGFTRR